ALFTLSRGFAGLIRALDAVYDVVHTRNFVYTRVVGIGLALGTLATLALTTFGWSAGTDAGVPIGLRLLAGVLVLVAWSATMYHLGPNLHTPWRYDLPGALFTAIGWIVLSLGFGWYVSIVGDGNQFVGATGAVLLGLTWLWAACSVFLIGGEINQLLADRAGVIEENDTLLGRAADLARQRLLDAIDSGHEETHAGADSDRPCEPTDDARSAAEPEVVAEPEPVRDAAEQRTSEP
ncbi:MAG: YihY/virulence factor BrkB family protein, partial [Actinomycetota bacterium]